MPEITNPMDGFVSLRAALKRGAVEMQPCEVYPDMEVHVDRPLGELRITYALRSSNGDLEAMASYVPVDPIDAVRCFGIGYAVAEHLRGRGLAQRVVAQSLEELRTGLSRNGVGPFHVEAIVATSNAPSNAVARKLLSEEPEEGTDEHSGEPILSADR